MTRRVILVLGLFTAGWILAGPAAGAWVNDGHAAVAPEYPPAPGPVFIPVAGPGVTPGVTPGVSPQAVPVVVVQGAPAPSGALALTGTSTGAAMVAVAAGSVLLGILLLLVVRRRHRSQLVIGPPTA